mgnify:FL=1
MLRSYYQSSRAESRIITYFHRSAGGLAALKVRHLHYMLHIDAYFIMYIRVCSRLIDSFCLQGELVKQGIPLKKFVFDALTRWNSTLDMTLSYMHQHTAAATTLTKLVACPALRLFFCFRECRRCDASSEIDLSAKYKSTLES